MPANAITTTPDTSDPVGGAIGRALAKVRRASPIVDKTLRTYGRSSISDYGRCLLQPPPPSLQDTGDFIRTVRTLAGELFGEETADQLETDLQQNPVALTANHHGVDYFAQSVQGSLIFTWMQREICRRRSTALVLSCGNIPLNNLTNPQGMLLYDTRGGTAAALPRKLPVFSNKLRHQAVCVAPGYTPEMIARAAGTADRLHREKAISTETCTCIKDLLAEDYGDPAIAAVPDYSRQATLLNHRICERLHAGCRRMPKVICLEMEKVASRLIALDIQHEERIVSRVLFDMDLQARVLRILDSQRACWEHVKTPGPASDPDFPPLRRGTHFFWGICEEGVKFPLAIHRGRGSAALLRGADKKGRRHEYPLSPESLEMHLVQRRLIPSMFTCFLALSLARGVNCLGGYYQAEYLPGIQAGMIQALSLSPGDRDMADTMRRVPTAGYLSGMQTVMIPQEHGRLLPAGPIEMLVRGGLTEIDVQRILSMAVGDAHRASLLETAPDIAPEGAFGTSWKHRMAQESFNILQERVVVK